MGKKDNPHYVNNKDFFNAMVIYHASAVEAKSKGIKEKPPINDYIALCIYKICNKLAHKHNFANYHFRDEMVADALLNCLTYIDRFDPEKSNNPFSYFTQFAFNAFIRRIKREHKELYTKYTMIGDTIMFDEKATQMQQYGDNASEDAKSIFMTKYETGIANGKKKKDDKLKNTANILF